MPIAAVQPTDGQIIPFEPEPLPGVPPVADLGYQHQELPALRRQTAEQRQIIRHLQQLMFEAQQDIRLHHRKLRALQDEVTERERETEGRAC